MTYNDKVDLATWATDIQDDAVIETEDLLLTYKAKQSSNEYVTLTLTDKKVIFGEARELRSNLRNWRSY